MRRSLLLSIALSFLMAAASAFVVDPVLGAGTLSIQLPGGSAFNFSENPRWVAVPGTRIYTVDGTTRPDFDIFRQGSYYYAYRGGTWYRASRWNGRYFAVSEGSIPVQFNTLSREHWRSYPPGWDRRNQHAKAKKIVKHNGKHGRH